MQDSILNVNVSCLKDYNTPTDPLPVNLLQWLISNKYQKEVDAIRQESDKEKRDSIKATLPAITPSGLFTHRSEAGLLIHSGFIQVDIDFKENSHITNYNQLKQQLCNIVNVAYCGLSVSGTGYFLLMPIAYPDKHRQHFDYIYKTFKSMGIAIDRKPRNVASLRGYSYNADGYFNHKAVKLEACELPQPKPIIRTYPATTNDTQSQVETLINAITKSNTDIAPNYNEWLNVGFAFATEFGEAGRQYFHDISQFYTNYYTGKTDRQYDKCLQSKGSLSIKTTIKTFFYLCKIAGIELPKQEVIKQVFKSSPKPIVKKVPANQPLQLCTADFIYNRGLTPTGPDFEQLIISHFEGRNGKMFELLYKVEGELLPPQEKPQTVKRLASFFHKTFVPAMLDTKPCLINIITPN